MSSSNELWAVVLAGGIGSRFWPASTPARPKQLLPLASDRPLIADTVERVLPLVPAERIRILASESLGAALLSAVPALGPGNLLAEPRARGTAPALAWAAASIAARAPHAVMVSLHADHVIDPPAAFRALLQATAAAARSERRLFTVGAVPTRMETGFGYIRAGALLAGGGHVVERFVEKPDRAAAARHIAAGCLWNTGIFVWPVDLLLDELRRHTPELAPLLPLLSGGDADGVAEFFERAPSLSIDEGLLERSDRVAVVAADFRWDDVGAWDALARTRPHDAAGNVAVGETHLVGARDTIVWCEDGAVVAFGVDDLVIVRVPGLTFVAPRARTADLKRLLAELPAELTGSDGSAAGSALPQHGDP